MRYGKLFDGHLPLPNPAMNLHVIRAFQPKFDRFLDHRFGMLWCFTLADDAQLRTIRYIPAILSWFDDSSKFGELHEGKVIP
jgi:hypothetical protein